MRVDSMLFLKTKRQEQERKDKLFKESLSAINNVQLTAIFVQNTIEIYKDHLTAKAKIAKLRNESEQLFKNL